MKKLIALGLAVFLGACAANGTDDAGSNDEAATSAAATSGAHGLSVESCQNKKECIDALVMRAIFSSDAAMTQTYDDKNTAKPLAREVLAGWLAKTNDARMSIKVEQGAAGTGTWNVSIQLSAGHETNKDEGDAEALILDFAIKSATIVGDVKGTYIG